MRQDVVIRVVARFIIPFIIMYGLYILFHGEYSPGGGFQGGVVMASAFVLHSLLYGTDRTKEVLPMKTLIMMSCAGVLLFTAVGLIPIALGYEFLNYNVLLPSPQHGQQLGIMLIEIGVGFTVFSTMLLIFYLFTGRSDEEGS